jgi:hypothetical protein
MHYLRGFITTFLLSVILATGWILVEEGLVIHLPSLAFGLLLGAIWSLVAQVLLSRLSFIELRPDGILGATFWGRRRFVEWKKIADARRSPVIFAMGFVRVITSDDLSPLWLPTHVSRQDSYVQHLRRVAPPDSPFLGCFTT